MISYYKHFTQKFGIPNDRVKKIGNIVYVHLPYLPEALTLFKDWSGEELVFVCEGGDVCLHLNGDILATGNTSQLFKGIKLSEISPKVKKIFSTNLNLKHPLFSVLPCGHYVTNDQINSIQPWNELDKKLVLCNFAPHTRGAAGYERSIILDIVKRNPWITFQDQGGGDGKESKLGVQDLLLEIARHKFVICPISNGYDTSRIWESLYLGAIPIIKRSAFSENLQDEGFPILTLDKWEDLNETSLLNATTDQINSINSTMKNKSLLLNDYWLNKISNA